MSSSTVFRGFPKSLFEFLSELAENNQRDWFNANKARYEQDVMQPTLEFITAMQKPLTKISPFLTAVPKRVGGSMMRIYRDTRFGKDKSPFKLNVGIHFRHEMGRDIHAPGLYVHLQPSNCFLAAGMWMPPAEPLAMIRQSIVENSQAWKKAKNDKRMLARYTFDGERLKTAPRGYEKDHPLIEDIKCKSFAALAKVKQSELTSANCVSTVNDILKDSRPLMRFLCESLQLPF
ncbi:MAG: DUF2461 domain-containing protein [Pirellulales bacterium]